MGNEFKFKPPVIVTFPDAPNISDALPGCYYWRHPSGMGFTANPAYCTGWPLGFVKEYESKFQRSVIEFESGEERARFAKAIGLE